MLRSNRFVFGLVFLILLSLLSFPVLAQDNPQNSQSTMGPHKIQGGPLINVTGCLKRSAEPSAYYITDSSGRTWELTSKSVDLSTDIYHVVSVAGHATPHSKQDIHGDPNDKSHAAGSQHFDMQVTQLELVSTSCTR
jgi:hypothetical protein